MISSPVASRIDGVSRFAREHGWHLMFQDRLGFASGLQVGVNVEGAARTLGISRNTLNRRISAELGRSASAELHRQRLMLAKRLLADPANKVEYVARMAGFSSASHLGSALRADCGLSPVAFRDGRPRS